MEELDERPSPQRLSMSSELRGNFGGCETPGEIGSSANRRFLPMFVDFCMGWG